MGPDFPRMTGGDFDFIVCHGVLSYVPQPEVALLNLAQCLRPNGLIYLGVNGADHFSIRLRPVLERLGCDLAVIPRERGWRRLLTMWEEEQGGARVGPFARLPDWYLGGDLFGPVIHRLALSEWVKRFRAAGLFLRGSFETHRALRPMVPADATSLFMGFARGEIGELMDIMHPVGFHRLLLTRETTPAPPWTDPAALLEWRPARTGLYRISSPGKRPRFPAIIRLKSRPLATQFAWPMPRWESEILRNCDGQKRLGQLLADTGHRRSLRGLEEQMFLLYQFAALNMFTP
jgi:hypothetical protein